MVSAAPSPKLTASALQHLQISSRSPALAAYEARETPETPSAQSPGNAYWGQGGFQVGWRMIGGYMGQLVGLVVGWLVWWSVGRLPH